MQQTINVLVSKSFVDKTSGIGKISAPSEQVPIDFRLWSEAKLIIEINDTAEQILRDLIETADLRQKDSMMSVESYVNRAKAIFKGRATCTQHEAQILVNNAGEHIGECKKCGFPMPIVTQENMNEPS